MSIRFDLKVLGMRDDKAFVLNKYLSDLFGEFLRDDSINEIEFNGDENVVFVEDAFGQKHKHIKKGVDFDRMLTFANACAQFNENHIDRNDPILSCLLPGGERAQIIIPPATDKGLISVTIRKPSKVRYSMQDYIGAGALDENFAKLLQDAVQSGKNIVICGETGSGKTTFMKTLIDFIPLSERIITIEDVSEITFYKHENRVKLYYPSEAKPGDSVTSAVLLKSTLRMKPDRILLAEVRGGETYDFLNVVSSGHDGSMTSCHAGSIIGCYNRLVMMAMQNVEARTLGKDMILDVVKSVVDVIVVFKRRGGKRQVIEYLYDGKVYAKNEKGEFECRS